MLNLLPFLESSLCLDTPNFTTGILNPLPVAFLRIGYYLCALSTLEEVTLLSNITERSLLVGKNRVKGDSISLFGTSCSTFGRSVC